MIVSPSRLRPGPGSGLRRRLPLRIGASVAGLLIATLASAATGPDVASTRPADQRASADGSRVPAGIDADRLADVSIDSTGALGIDDGALPPHMWRGTPMSLVDELLPRLPVASPSPATRSLVRRLVLSAAVPPAGDVEPGRLLERRAAILWRMNATDDLIRLSEAVPAHERSSQLMRLVTDARLLAGDIGDACATARGRIADDPDIYWQKVLGFCQAVTGEADAAQLTLALLAERDADTGAYRTLILALLGGAGASDSETEDPDPLELAMLRAAGTSPDPEAAESDNLPVLAAIARSEPFAPSIRLAAGRRAVAAGAMPADNVLPLYALAPPPPRPPLTARRGFPRTIPGPASDDGVRAAVDAPPGERVEAAVRALEAGRRYGAWLESVRLVAPWLDQAAPEGHSPAVAREVVPAMLVLGDRSGSAAWIRSLADQAPTSPEAADVLSTLRVLAHLARLPGEDWRPEDLVAASGIERSRPGGRARVERMLGLLQATGDSVPDSAWIELLQGPAQTTGPGIDAAFRTQLDRASRAGRVGETVLLVLVAAGTVGTERLGTGSLAALVGGLRAVGLQSDALAFSVESLAAR